MVRSPAQYFRSLDDSSCYCLRLKQRLSRAGSMLRREFITLIGGAAAGPFAAMAQEPGRTYRLGCLVPWSWDWQRRALASDVPVNVAFFDEVRRRGFIEGQNLTIDYRAFAGHVDLISQYAAELIKAQPDVIYACWVDVEGQGPGRFLSDRTRFGIRGRCSAFNSAHLQEWQVGPGGRRQRDDF
jgi:hypothetical protein